jgi:hypothetical protein
MSTKQTRNQDGFTTSNWPVFMDGKWLADRQDRRFLYSSARRRDGEGHNNFGEHATLERSLPNVQKDTSASLITYDIFVP